jgi:hypothetical protein
VRETDPIADRVFSEPTKVRSVSLPVTPRIEPPSRAINRPIDHQVPARSESGREETVVHVTIGRIEVRAVREPAKPAPQPARPPAMSLEEYLRRRSEGAR